MSDGHGGRDRFPCHCCGRRVKRKPRTGKARYPHKCPHGEWCVTGHRLLGVHANWPKCAECLKALGYEPVTPKNRRPS